MLQGQHFQNNNRHTVSLMHYEDRKETEELQNISNNNNISSGKKNNSVTVALA